MYLINSKIINKSNTLDISYTRNKNFFFINIKNKLNNQKIFFKIKQTYACFYKNKNMNSIAFYFYFYEFSILKTIFNLILNKSKGLIKGFFLELEIKGLGYFVFLYKNFLLFDLNYSHFIGINIPSNIIIKKLKNRLVFFSFDKELLMKYFKIICSLKKIDIYKGKGIFLRGQKLKLKEIKKK